MGYLYDDHTLLPALWAATLTPPRGVDGHDRLEWIVREIKGHVRPSDDPLTPTYVVVEGPAYWAQRDAPGLAHERAGLWWLVTHYLWRVGVPTAVAGPSCVKKYAAGKGTAGKDRVLAAMVRLHPDVVDGNDEADALACALMGARHYRENGHCAAKVYGLDLSLTSSGVACVLPGAPLPADTIAKTQALAGVHWWPAADDAEAVAR